MVAPILPVVMQAAVVKRRGKTLLGPVDLTLGAGGLSIVMGPNGAGKTTLLRALHGLERLSAGSVRWAVPFRETLRQQAFVFQTPIMLRRTVRENLVYPLRLAGMDGKAAMAMAENWAARIGLDAMLDQQAPRLSGGEKQKLALARALMRRPQIVFLDEPCANLDGRAMREIETILCDARDAGTRIVMATHDIGQARRLASDVLFMMAGQVIEAAPAAQFFDTPQTPQAVALLKGDIVE